MSETNRESLNKDLETRYRTEKAGGAYDAKQAGFVMADGFPNTFADGFTKGGKNTNMPKTDSLYVKGLDTRRYK